MKAGHHPAPRLPRELSRWGWGEDAVRPALGVDVAAGLWRQPILRRWTVCASGSARPGQTVWML